MDAYLSQWLRGGDAGPGATHGGDDPHNGLDGRPPPGGWPALPAYDDARDAAAVAAHGGQDAGAGTPSSSPGAMPFDPAARAGNLYSGGFVPLLNYGWANQGNPGLQVQVDPNNPYAGYSAGMRRLDTGLATLSGKPDPTGAGRQQPAAAPATTAPGAAQSGSGTPVAAGGGGEGGGRSGGGQAAHDPTLDDDLHRFLYEV
jgi:hypothetical protein